MILVSYIEGDLAPEADSSINKKSSLRATTLYSNYTSIRLGLSANTEYNKVGSSDINILTPDSSTDVPMAHRRLLSYHSGAKLGPGLCPHWKVHSTDRNLWKGCQMCKSHLRRMFADLVLDGW
ncbi:LOW QUALITY PROTEIN: hypothetical protein IFM47457_11098 [Aspergillus lentulus]|nr:LOW QUALITY PROTEIN: hypothetical protein IFM47457_11098 [Aspergillus lentulus]